MSALEDEFAAQLKAVKVPFEREVRFHPNRKWRLDFVSGKVAIECEGGIYVNGGHNRGAAMEDQFEKYAEALLAGYTVFRVSARQIRSGQALKWLERAIEQAGGWKESSL